MRAQHSHVSLPAVNPQRKPQRVRTLFLSDIHTGTRACRAGHGYEHRLPLGNITFINCCGRFDSCIAMVERLDGRMVRVRREPEVRAANDEQGKVVPLHTADAA